VTSRRGDFEILSYNLLQWACGRLPWEDDLSSPEHVHAEKKAYMANIPSLMRNCFPNGNAPASLEKFVKYSASLQFNATPDYNHCRQILSQGIKEMGFKDDGKLNFTADLKTTAKVTKPKKTKKKAELENQGQPKRKAARNSPRSSANTLRSPNSGTNGTKESTPSTEPAVILTPAMLLIQKRLAEKGSGSVVNGSSGAGSSTSSAMLDDSASSDSGIIVPGKPIAKKRGAGRPRKNSGATRLKQALDSSKKRPGQRKRSATPDVNVDISPPKMRSLRSSASRSPELF